MEFTFGADPELFVQKDGKFVSAHDLIPGTKAAPHPVNKGAVQVDGMALEFNIDPAKGYNAFATNINTVLAELRKMVPPEYEFVLTPVADFDQDYLDSRSEVERELGCDPDLNAYTEEANPAPKATSTMRTAAGHIHIGWTEDADIYDPGHRSIAFEIVKELDAHIGVWSVTRDRDQRRRELYGKAGACRIKPYGVEYRVLSNFWLAQDNDLSGVYHLAGSALHRVARGESIIPSLENYEVEEIINTGNYDAARQLCGDNYGM
jgi:hypothetical protein